MTPEQRLQLTRVLYNKDETYIPTHMSNPVDKKNSKIYWKYQLDNQCYRTVTGNSHNQHGTIEDMQSPLSGYIPFVQEDDVASFFNFKERLLTQRFYSNK